MSDIKIIWDTEIMGGDFSFEDSDFIQDEGLETAVLISLYTDRRALEDDKYENDNRRGWFSDLINTDGDQIGSRLWLLERAKNTGENINACKEYILEALEWMKTDGVAKEIQVETETSGLDRLYFKVKILKADGNEESFKYEALWDAQMGG